jgi:hypothetical protein
MGDGFAVQVGLFDDAGEVVGLDVVVPHDLWVRLALGVGQAAVGQFRWGGGPCGRPADPVRATSRSAKSLT